MIQSATSPNAFAGSPSGSETVIGIPMSPPSRSAGTRGMRPMSGTSRRSASSSPPPPPQPRVARAVVAGEPRHVLDHATHRDADVLVLEHGPGALGDALRRRLRRGDDIG